MKKREITLLAMILLTGLLLFSCGVETPQVLATVRDNPDLKRIHLNGVDFHYSIYGEGNPQTLMVLHGGPGQDHYYLQNFKAFSDRYQVVLYDQRGSGLSQRVPDDQLTMEAFIEDLHAFIETFSPQGPVSIVGHSWGAILASSYASTYPETVDHLILAEPGFLENEGFQAFMEKTHFGRPPINGTVLKHLWNTWRESKKIQGPDADAEKDYFYLQLAFGLPIEDHPLGGYFKDGNIENGEIEIKRFGFRAGVLFPQKYVDKEGTFTYHFAENAAEYKGNTLFLTSEYNQLIGTEHQREYNLPFYPQAELVEIPQAGHNMFSSNQEESFAVLRVFLDN